MHEKMHCCYEKQQNKVSVIENLARATAKVMETILKNNKIDQNKVSIVIEKKEVDDRLFEPQQNKISVMKNA